MSNVSYTDNGTAIKAALRAGYKRNITAATMILFRALQKKFTGKRGYRQYTIPGTKGKKYWASAPGEAPAVRLGKLKSSYVFEVDEMYTMMRGRVGSDLKYARHLEKGTSTIKPRPALQPALTENLDKIRAALGKPIK